MRYGEFLANSQRSDKGANDVTHFFSKYFFGPVAFICFRLRMSPNQVTWLFLCLGCLSGVFLYLHMPILAYVFWRLHIILDMADGALARATGNFSPLATGFDRCNHIVVNTTVISAVAFQYGSVVSANALIVSFYLYYFFQRNFHREGTSEVVRLALWSSIVRHVLGIEGFVLFSCLIMSWPMLTLSFYS